MTDEDVVRRFAEVIGIGKVTLPRQTPGRKQLYQWRAFGGAAMAHLDVTIGPWLGERRRARLDEAMTYEPQREGSHGRWIGRRWFASQPTMSLSDNEIRSLLVITVLGIGNRAPLRHAVRSLGLDRLTFDEAKHLRARFGLCPAIGTARDLQYWCHQLATRIEEVAAEDQARRESARRRRLARHSPAVAEDALPLTCAIEGCGRGRVFFDDGGVGYCKRHGNELGLRPHGKVT